MTESELKKIEELFVSFLGETKNGFTVDGQAQFNCPKCKEENGGIPDDKYNLEVNIFKGVFKCWKCCATDSSMQGSIIYLIRKYGGVNVLKKYYEIMQTSRDSKYLDPHLFKNIEKAIKGEDFISLPETFQKIDLNTITNKELYDYLIKRKLTQDIIDTYNIGYTTRQEPRYILRNRIIIPSYDDDGYLTYWVGRDFTERNKSKYFNVKAQKDEIIFKESHIQWDADIYLCEGAIDCLYYPNSIALMGKTLNKKCKLYNALFEKANANIIICLDGDTNIEETKRIYKLLNQWRLKEKIWYIRLGSDKIPYKDFGDIYEHEEKKGLINAFKQKKQFKEIELL